jgi:hypothetical protein
VSFFRLCIFYFFFCRGISARKQAPVAAVAQLTRRNSVVGRRTMTP